MGTTYHAIIPYISSQSCILAGPRFCLVSLYAKYAHLQSCISSLPRSSSLPNFSLNTAAKKQLFTCLACIQGRHQRPASGSNVKCLWSNNLQQQEPTDKEAGRHVYVLIRSNMYQNISYRICHFHRYQLHKQRWANKLSCQQDHLHMYFLSPKIEVVLVSREISFS